MLLTVLGLLVQMAAPDPDSDDRILRAAQAAQSRFERFRRAHLPLNPGEGATNHCTARVGRYCYWYDPTDTAVVPEPRRITDARSELLATLDSLGALALDDDWIIGQRIRYQLEGDNWSAAAAIARGCGATAWWCAALEGLALHVGERYGAADSTFSAALAAMPFPRRCEWVDVREVIEGPWHRDLARADCGEREAMADRLWKVSQPLWVAGGSDLRTEHLARRTMAAILEHSANAHAMSFGNDSRELLMRFGWAKWFTRHEVTPSQYMSYGVTGHDREPSYYFFPDVQHIRGFTSVAPGAWRLNDPMAPTRYAPRHIRSLVTLPHQLARFVRADSMLVAVAYTVQDSQLARDTVSVTLALYERGRVRLFEEHTPGWLLGMAARDTAIASLEALGKGTRRAARSRYAIAPLPCRAGWCLSDLLLIDPARADSPDDAENAIRAALPGTTVAHDTPIGVFWELSGTPGPRPVTLSLTVTPLRVSVARRLASRLRLVAPASPVRLRWETVLRREREGQHVTLRLPASARGRYRVQLTIEGHGGEALVAARELEVLR